MLLAVGRRMLTPKAPSFDAIENFFKDRVGLEIGGPSAIFARGGLLPLYPLVAGLDNCNFNRTTIWEGSLEEGRTFLFDKSHERGYQFIREATYLSGIPSSAYDFVLSSHTLEHIANPLKALCEWSRVLKDEGVLVLIVPEKEGTFDHRRPVTRFDHLLRDFEQDTTENDLTHVPEILALHDLQRDPGAGSRKEFEARCQNNAHLRCIHHHVFDTALAMDVVSHAGLRVVAVEELPPHHILVVGQKGTPGRVGEELHQ